MKNVTRRGQKCAKKCHVLFEWLLRAQNNGSREREKRGQELTMVSQSDSDQLQLNNNAYHLSSKPKLTFSRRSTGIPRYLWSFYLRFRLFAIKGSIPIFGIRGLSFAYSRFLIVFDIKSSFRFWGPYSTHSLFFVSDLAVF